MSTSTDTATTSTTSVSSSTLQAITTSATTAATAVTSAVVMPLDDYLYAYIVRWPCVALAAAAIAFDVFSVAIMARTRRMQPTVKMLCVAMLIHETLFLVSHLIYEFLPAGALKTRAVQMRRAFIQECWFLTTILALERFSAVVFPFHFIRSAKKTVKWFIAGSNVFLIIRLVYYFITAFRTDDTQDMPSWLLVSGSNIIVMVCAIITAASYCKIILEYRKSVRALIATLVGKRVNRPNIFRATRVLMGITLCFVLLNLPVVIESQIGLMRGNTRHYDEYTFVLIFVCCLINPIMYIWRFTECRMIFMSLLVHVFKCKKLEGTYTKMRVNVFDIPPLSLQATGMNTAGTFKTKCNNLIPLQDHQAPAKTTVVTNICNISIALQEHQGSLPQ